MAKVFPDSNRYDGVDELYTKYRKYFVGVAMSYIRNRMVAEDIVADSFIAYMENSESADINSAPAYILKSVRNRCLNWMESYRQHSKVHEDMSSTASRMNEMNISSYEVTEPHSVFFAEAHAIISRELRKMPERTRKVFVAHRYEDMSYKEISRIYGLTEGQIQYEIRSAKAILKEALKDFNPIVVFFLIF